VRSTSEQQGAGPDDGEGPSPLPHPGADPGDGRGESPNQRLDRNWIEILQELRVTQTGTQILTGFLLAIAFQPAFDRLEEYQQRVYVVLVVVAVLTTALGLAPVSLHRSLFRRRAKRVVVRAGHLILRLVLVGVGLVLTGTLLLVVDVVLGLTAGLVAAGVLVVVLVAIALLPLLLERSHGSAADG
jgi:uncharacterized protein DUF6328